MKIRAPKLIRKLFSPARKIYNIIWNKIKLSIRAELIVIFGVCLVISLIGGSIVGNMFENNIKSANIDYSSDSKRIIERGTYAADIIAERKLSINDTQNIQRVLEEIVQLDNDKVIICDLDGKVLYKSDNANETQIDIYTTIRNSMEVNRNMEEIYRRNSNAYRNKEIISLYPINFTDGRGYVIVSGMPEGNIVYYRTNNGVAGAISVLVIFLLSFYFITNKKMKYIQIVSNGLLEISKGNLDFRIERQGDDELASLADNINNMAEELKFKIDNERRIEKAKTELITNVSHDLRTPLTSIKGYLGLIREKRYTEEEQLEQYVNIAYNKSEKLEVLINDLFEYTKLTSDTVNIDKQKVVLNGLLEQLADELVPISEENNVSISQHFIDEKVTVNIDANKTVRVFENLLMNAIRYSLKPGDIKVVLKKEEKYAVVSIQNKCEPLSKEDLERIFDRFYRAEKSRSSDTGGSGLGLAIAKNIVELQGGSITAEYKEDYISFDVRLRL